MFKVWPSESQQCPELSANERTKRINELRTLIENSDLKNQVETKDIIMIACLHARDWNVELAMKRLIKLEKFCLENPGYIVDQHAKAYEKLLFKNVSTMLDGRDKNGRRVYLVNVSLMGSEEDINFKTMYLLHSIWFSMISYEPETIVNGVSIIFDLKNVGWDFIRWFSGNMAGMTSKLAGLAPIRNVNYHVINTSTATITITNILLTFCGKRIREKFHIHSDTKSLSKYLGSEVLPSKFGGPESNALDYDKLRDNLYHVYNTHPKKALRKMKCEPDIMTKPIIHERLR
uniref:CSON006011 protein n=1 Tax=Culicoides sonorensis TaxID=179676 RepID=A0A336JY32_CULSO